MVFVYNQHTTNIKNACLVNTPWSDIGCMHSGSTGTLIKFHHFLTFLQVINDTLDGMAG